MIPVSVTAEGHYLDYGKLDQNRIPVTRAKGTKRGLYLELHPWVGNRAIR